MFTSTVAFSLASFAFVHAANLCGVRKNFRDRTWDVKQIRFSARKDVVQGGGVRTL